MSRVQTGDTLALGGMTLYRRPVAFTRILANLPEPPTDLTLLGFPASYESDLLIGAGLVSAIRACYTGLEIFGLAPHFTEAAQQGRLKVIEESEASLAFGIRAQLAGVSFMPAQGWLGTDLLKLRPDVKVIDDPYRPGEQIVAFPAVEWHIAVIHALRATPSGNAVINGNMGIDSELALGAKREVIITTEEIVEDLNERIHITGAVVTGSSCATRSLAYILLS